MKTQIKAKLTNTLTIIAMFVTNSYASISYACIPPGTDPSLVSEKQCGTVPSGENKSKTCAATGCDLCEESIALNPTAWCIPTTDMSKKCVSIVYPGGQTLEINYTFKEGTCNTSCGCLWGLPQERTVETDHYNVECTCQTIG